MLSYFVVAHWYKLYHSPIQWSLNNLSTHLKRLGRSAFFVCTSDPRGTSIAGEQSKNPSGWTIWVPMFRAVTLSGAMYDKKTIYSMQWIKQKRNQLGWTCTFSMKPMCSTGITGQSSSLGTWATPKTYLQLQNTCFISHAIIDGKICT